MSTNKPLLATLSAPFIGVILFLILLNFGLHIDQSLLTAGGATATLYLGLINYWINTDNIFKSLFITFNKRFDKLHESLNNIILHEKLGGNKTSDQIIQDYLNLCSEEYYWKIKGRIPNNVWISWMNGIKYYLEYPEVRIYFKQQKDQKGSYYGFFSYLEKNQIFL